MTYPHRYVVREIPRYEGVPGTGYFSSRCACGAAVDFVKGPAGAVNEAGDNCPAALRKAMEEAQGERGDIVAFLRDGRAEAAYALAIGGTRLSCAANAIEAGEHRRKP